MPQVFLMIFDPPVIYFRSSLWFLTKWFLTKWTFVTSQLGHCSLAKDCESLPNRSSTIGATRRRWWRHDPAARTESKNLCSSDGRVGRNYSNVEHRRYIFFCWSLFKLTSVNVFVHQQFLLENRKGWTSNLNSDLTTTITFMPSDLFSLTYTS